MHELPALHSAQGNGVHDGRDETGHGEHGRFDGDGKHDGGRMHGRGGSRQSHGVLPFLHEEKLALQVNTRQNRKPVPESSGSGKEGIFYRALSARQPSIRRTRHEIKASRSDLTLSLGPVSDSVPGSQSLHDHDGPRGAESPART